MGMQIFSLIVLLTIGSTLLGLLVFLAMWPGRTARVRHHPYADAVNVAGWVTILTGGLFWPAALVWAYACTPPAAAKTSDVVEKQGA
jgi:hypothetical protein